MDELKLLVSKREASMALAVSVRTIENLIARKALVVRRIGRRTLIPRADLEQFIKRDHPTKEPRDGR